MYRYPPPPVWASGAEVGYDFGHGPRPPPHFASPPPGYPMLPPVSGWGPCRGPPPRAFPPMGFPPRQFPPRVLAPGLRPPPPRGMTRPLPPGAGPAPIGFSPGTVPPPTGLPPGAPPLFGLPPGVPPPTGLPPSVPLGFPPPRGFPPRPPFPSPPAGNYHPQRAGYSPGPGCNGASPTNNYMNNRPSSGTNNQWSEHKRQAGENFTKQKQKRQKVDKRDLPENNAYFCEVCDRGFKAEDLYTNHVNSHEKCTVEGCQYTAHPKLVKLHYECQHRTGLAKRIWQMESKEDVDKWISERKLHYPTPENMQRKKNERLQKVRSGAVLENKVFGKLHARGRRGGGRSRGRGGNNSQRVHWENSSTVNNETEEGAGIGEPIVADESPVLTDVNREPDGKDAPPCILQAAKGRNHGKRQKEGTLLEKLLAPDIRHERNVLLQCVRYVVEKFNLNQNGVN